VKMPRSLVGRKDPMHLYCDPRKGALTSLAQRTAGSHSASRTGRRCARGRGPAPGPLAPRGRVQCTERLGPGPRTSGCRLAGGQFGWGGSLLKSTGGVHRRRQGQSCIRFGAGPRPLQGPWGLRPAKVTRGLGRLESTLNG